jgi:hypothetical protein
VARNGRGLEKQGNGDGSIAWAFLFTPACERWNEVAMAAKRPRFFEKIYDGRRFAGIVTADGPYVFDLTAKRGSALYRSTIVHYGRVQWWVAEGGVTNSRIPLNSLSDTARKELACDFGLSFSGVAALSPIAEQEQFHKAAAVEGLIHWIAENSGSPTQHRGDGELDWASMISRWKAKLLTRTSSSDG